MDVTHVIKQYHHLVYQAPPVCAGSQCEEIYPGTCVVYSGPNISCLGITNGMSLNDIVQVNRRTIMF